jgi:hypothetical protein
LSINHLIDFLKQISNEHGGQPYNYGLPISRAGKVEVAWLQSSHKIQAIAIQWLEGDEYV